MHGTPPRISTLLGLTRSSLNNLKVRRVGKDEYVYNSHVRNMESDFIARRVKGNVGEGL